MLEIIEGAGNMKRVRIQNAHANAEIALQGAHLLSWQPVNQAPVVWLSPQAKFTPGKSVRGGIPVCWPWFGVHERADFPAHGFARTQMWSLESSEELADGTTQAVFELQLNDVARLQWPYPCRLQLTMNIGATLTMALQTENTGHEAFVMGEALHTYFAVGDISEVIVTGLEDCDYLDKVEGFKQFHQSGDVTVSAEVDRVYLDTSSDCVIHDARLNRSIHISKTGSATTVVWNPWVVKSDEMGDMGEAGYRHMICVESANTHKNVVTLQPGETHTLEVRYWVER